jgi:hypothetical protein
MDHKNHVDSLQNSPSDPRLLHCMPKQFEQFSNSRRYCNAAVIWYVTAPTTLENRTFIKLKFKRQKCRKFSGVLKIPTYKHQTVQTEQSNA